MHTHEDVPFSPPHFSTEMMDPHHELTQLEPWIENLSDFVWVFDREFHSLKIDRRVSRLSLQEPDDLLGRSAWETFPELTETFWGQELRKTADDGLPRRFEFFHPSWKRWLDCRVSLAGNHLYVLANDTTSLKKTEAALQETRQELESFSYSIAHDMRGPLRAMQSFARILQEECGGNLSTQGTDYLRRIVAASERLDHLIRDALAYSQLFRTELPLSPIDLTELLKEILESYPEFQAPHATISILHPLPVVRGNAVALTQCLANLIDNGLKFSKSTKPALLEIWSESRGSRARIHIKDRGIGIDPAFHRKIFSLFYQHDPSYPGTGVGLVVVRKAAEKMNGSVGVESELGKGSTFYLELDLAK